MLCILLPSHFLQQLVQKKTLYLSQYHPVFSDHVYYIYYIYVIEYVPIMLLFHYLFLHPTSSKSWEKSLTITRFVTQFTRQQRQNIAFNPNQDKETPAADSQKCISLRLSSAAVTSLPSDDDTLAFCTRRKRIIFQWKPKPYCWECTIWSSKGFTPTSIFSGI